MCYPDEPNPYPKMMPCTYCDGTGLVDEEDFIYDEKITLKEICKKCSGQAYLEVDPQDEIDNQADLKHDDI